MSSNEPTGRPKRKRRTKKQVADLPSFPGRPTKWEGRYIEASGRGCKTCGWRISNDLPDADEQWTTHEHDPLIDITERVLAGARHFTDADVVWLLALLDPDNWAFAETVSGLPTYHERTHQF